jgi:flagella basal body P-ring formation protein FlgA
MPTLPTNSLLAVVLIGIGVAITPPAAVAASTSTKNPTTTAEAPAAVTAALDGALGVSGARLELVSWRATEASAAKACTPETATLGRPITASGRYAVKLAGAGCEGWGWATVRVLAPGFVTTRVVRAGESLEGSVREVEQEIRGIRVPAIVREGAKAARTINAGQMIEAAHVEDGRPGTGTTVKVAIRSGSLQVTQFGRAVACGAGKTCAVLPSGKHVEGVIENDTLVVEMQ